MIKKSTLMILALSATVALCLEPQWIFFADKGFPRGSYREGLSVERARERLSTRCLARRSRARAGLDPVDFADIDVEPEYISRLEDLGAKKRVVSRWLNAVSVEAEQEILEEIDSLPFVSKIRPVGRFHRTRPTEPLAPLIEDWYYGASYEQNRLLGTPRIHRLGITGEGVLICMTDTGFKLDHQAFDSAGVLGAYDFIDGDSIVSYEPGDPPPSESHGTKTWSVVGGFYPGQLVGTAFGASFLLARTEHYTMEDPIEEDYWIAAAEWADSAGADIISASIGYSDWYTPDSMTGDIAPISVAADLMADLGICVVVSAGNNGSYGPISITAPADADSVIAVGAVDFYGNALGFSSRGPSFDGRTKPEVAALGTGVRGASSTSSGSYGYGSGTSVSTPLVAGLAALILDARPGLLPMDVRAALIGTASNCIYPNNDIGWGVPDVYAAMSFPVGGELKLPVFAGWNLVSIPLSNDVHLDSVFGGRIGPVWYWDNDSGDYVEVGFVEPGKGYFVLYGTDTLLSARGDSLCSVDIPVTPGWHAIGGVRVSDPWGRIIASSTANLLDIYIFDTIRREYITAGTVAPGRGAFVLVTGAGNIHISD